jgi:predicted TIM-barrel fold metal-dependent hydrolase
MEKRYLPDFDEYLATHKHWLSIRSDDQSVENVWSEEWQDRRREEAKVKAGGLEGLWDPGRRLREVEQDGIVAEVLFPDEMAFNTPPFSIGHSSAVIAGDQHEFTAQQKLAGARAYNRWLAEFCSAAPNRLLGLALIGSLEDVPSAVGVIRQAHADGLRSGIMLPMHYSGLPFYDDPRYEPIWSTCAELNMPVHSHAGTGGPDQAVTSPSALMVQALESFWFAHRPLWYLIFGGVLDRHPNLKLIFTEQGSKWVVDTLRLMDDLVVVFAHRTERHLGSLKPSECFQRQCWIGASLINDTELAMRHEIGVNKLMWGSDYPHPEGTWPNTAEHNRMLFAGVPEADLHAIMGTNALAAYDLDGDGLREVAAQVGPHISDIVTGNQDFDGGLPAVRLGTRIP